VSADRFERAVAAIDRANADDPNAIVVRGERRPKELGHAEMVTEWVDRLRPDASEALRLAARGHHLRRWLVPRSSFPDGRAGYLRWRRELHDRHARDLGDILRDCGYEDEIVGRVQAIVRKDALRTDPEVQALEDALCLVFLETQLEQIAARFDDAKCVEILVKAMRKMTPAGIEAARGLPLGEHGRRLLDEAAGR
jgi:hypothetical protein